MTVRPAARLYPDVAHASKCPFEVLFIAAHMGESAPPTGAAPKCLLAPRTEAAT